MPSPFPGMDPYLEAPLLWPDVHHGLLSGIQDQLIPKLRPAYVARVEQYTFLFEPDDPASELYIIPDVRILHRPELHEAGSPRGAIGTTVGEPIDVTGLLRHAARHRYIEIRDPSSREVVTVIEVLSPGNKRRGARGRNQFLAKREEVTSSKTSWLEIDLLRTGSSTIDLPRSVQRSDYLVYANRTTVIQDERREWVLPMSLRQPLPAFRVPLRGDESVELDLQSVLSERYDRGAYDLELDYSGSPVPPLEPSDAAWADALLREKNLRR